ncbi:hypothetical protein [Bacillus sp. P14.5]|nr:hypothetical protein [Bacillus sp. P14.5]
MARKITPTFTIDILVGKEEKIYSLGLERKTPVTRSVGEEKK